MALRVGSYAVSWCQLKPLAKEERGGGRKQERKAMRKEFET